MGIVLAGNSAQVSCPEDDEALFIESFEGTPTITAAQQLCSIEDVSDDPPSCQPGNSHTYTVDPEGAGNLVDFVKTVTCDKCKPALLIPNQRLA